MCKKRSVKLSLYDGPLLFLSIAINASETLYVVHVARKLCIRTKFAKLSNDCISNQCAHTSVLCVLAWQPCNSLLVARLVHCVCVSNSMQSLRSVYTQLTCGITHNMQCRSRQRHQYVQGIIWCKQAHDLEARQCIKAMPVHGLNHIKAKGTQHMLPAASMS